MIGLIPAAGLGTRMSGFDQPKLLLPVGGKPILEHAVDQFVQAGITNVYVVVSPENDTVQNLLGDGSRLGLEIEYVTQETPEGLGHAILQAKDRITEPFATVLGDTLLAPKTFLKEVVQQHTESGADVTLVLHAVHDPERFGVVELDETGKLTAIEEKPELPKTDLAVVGMYAFNPILFEYLEKVTRGAKNEYQLTDALRQMLADGKNIQTITHTGTWYDIGTPAAYAAANEALRQAL